MTTYRETVPLDSENDVEVEFEWTPGQAADHDDPGAGEDFYIVSFDWLDGNAARGPIAWCLRHDVSWVVAEQRIESWLDLNWMRPEPDPGRAYDERRDRELEDSL